MSFYYIPSTSVRGTVGSPSQPRQPSGASEWTLDPWCTSSGKPSQRPHSWRGWKTRGYIRRLSGLTLPRSSHHELTLSWEASRASLGVRQGSGKATKTSGTCGTTRSDSSGSPAPGCSSLRTSEGSEKPFPVFSGTLPSSGGMRSGRVSKRPRLEPRTSGGGSSSSLGTIPTPTATDWKGSSRPGLRRGQLTDWLVSLPTPTVADSRNTRNATSGRGKRGGKGGNPGVTLCDWLVLSGGQLPTPTASTYGNNRGGAAGRAGKIRPSLNSLASGVGLRLNPEFVEWMMGLPIGWTGSEPLGMESCRFRERLLTLVCYADPS